METLLKVPQCLRGRALQLLGITFHILPRLAKREAKAKVEQCSVLLISKTPGAKITDTLERKAEARAKTTATLAALCLHRVRKGPLELLQALRLAMEGIVLGLSGNSLFQATSVAGLGRLAHWQHTDLLVPSLLVSPTSSLCLLAQLLPLLLLGLL